MASVYPFSPAFGKEQDLNKISVKDGQLIITHDTGKIYLDYSGARKLVGESKNNNNFQTGTFFVSSWQYDDTDEIFYQSVPMTKVSGDYPLLVDLVISSDPYTGIQEDNEWGKITRIVANEGAIVGYCYGQPPGIDLNFKVKEI